MREAPALAGVTGKASRSNGGQRAKSPAPRRGGRGAQISQGSLVGRAFARPGVTIAGAVFAALMTGVVANALFLQKGHHPSPLFSANHGAGTEPAKNASPVEPPHAAPAPAPAPVVPAPVQATAAPASQPAQPAARVPAAAPVAPKPKAKAAPSTHVDGIGQLLGHASGRPAVKPAAKAVQHSPEPIKLAPKPHKVVAPAAAAPHT